MQQMEMLKQAGQFANSPMMDPSKNEAMAESFKELKKRNCDMVWCNARLAAVPFYKSVGFKIIGDLFNIAGIGPHYYMYKEL